MDLHFSRQPRGGSAIHRTREHLSLGSEGVHPCLRFNRYTRVTQSNSSSCARTCQAAFLRVARGAKRETRAELMKCIFTEHRVAQRCGGSRQPGVNGLAKRLKRGRVTKAKRPRFHRAFFVTCAGA